MISEKDRQSIELVKALVSDLEKQIVNAQSVVATANKIISVLQTDSSEEYITTGEAAAELGLGRSTVVSQIKNGNIRAHRVEREYRIAKSEIQRIKEGRITD